MSVTVEFCKPVQEIPDPAFFGMENMGAVAVNLYARVFIYMTVAVTAYVAASVYDHNPLAKVFGNASCDGAARNPGPDNEVFAVFHVISPAKLKPVISFKILRAYSFYVEFAKLFD